MGQGYGGAGCNTGCDTGCNTGCNTECGCGGYNSFPAFILFLILILIFIVLWWRVLRVQHPQINYLMKKDGIPCFLSQKSP